MPKCVICGRKKTEKAHVKPKHTFNEDQDDTRFNIIDLCPTHHELLDDNKIYIIKPGYIFLILEDIRTKDIIAIKTLTPIAIRDEYIDEKNKGADMYLIIEAMKYYKNR